MRTTELAGRRVVVWGAGREGRAAISAARLAGAAEVRVVDDHPTDDAVAPDSPGVLDRAEVVVVSPGVSRYDPRVAALRERGVATTGTVLWLAEHRLATVAVTGSKGKSTTSALTAHLLTSLGMPTVFGGNIGTPLLDLPEADRYVVELSSYQCSSLAESPRVVGLTSLFPEHLNWHGSVERYYADKLNVIAHGPDAVVYNALDPVLAPRVQAVTGAGRLIPVGPADGLHAEPDALYDGGEALVPRTVLPIRGEHNALNACIALGLVRECGIDLLAQRSQLAEAFSSFDALPFRLSVVASRDGVDFVDDSLSTAPQAAVAALHAFAEGPVALIVGGQDRGVDYAPLVEELRTTRRAVTVVGIPDSGERIAGLVGHLPGVGSAVAGDLAEAVGLAVDALPEGGTVLLSPAAPSYGVYRDHTERSAAFRAAIDALA